MKCEFRITRNVCRLAGSGGCTRGNHQSPAVVGGPFCSKMAAFPTVGVSRESQRLLLPPPFLLPSILRLIDVSLSQQQQNPFFAHTQYNKGSMGSVGSCQNTLQMCCAILLHTLKYTCRGMCSLSLSPPLSLSYLEGIIFSQYQAKIGHQLHSSLRTKTHLSEERYICPLFLATSNKVIEQRR